MSFFLKDFLIIELDHSDSFLSGGTDHCLTYDDDDRITNWQSGATNISPVLDVDGNMTTGVLEGQEETFVYDSRNRLTQAGTTTYTYDAEDRRIRKTESGITTTYIHDPHAPLSRLLQKTTGNTTTHYVYAAGQLLYEETDGQITLYHFDSRGSTRALSDSTGFVVNRITYGTYGEIVATTTAPTTPFLYNGAYGVQTDDNGLLHMRARYYSTELRRFINADPIQFAGGINWYAYAGGNPINRFDPFGLDWLDAAANFSAGFGDAISFGLTRMIRDNIDFYDGSVDYSSASYTTGELSGTIAGMATGTGIGLRVGAKIGGSTGGRLLVKLSGTGRGATGTSFSHFVPRRFFARIGVTEGRGLLGVLERSALNGNIVPNLRHLLHDATNFRNFSHLYGNLAPKNHLPLIFRMVDRFPRSLVGGILGGTPYALQLK